MQSIRSGVGIVLVVLTIAVAANRADAGFNANNRETFAGTTIDTATWYAVAFSGMVTQNNGLTVESFGGVKSELCSNYAIAGIGTTVRIPVTTTRLNGAISGDLFVMLTSDTSGPTNTWNYDDAYIGMQYDGSRIYTIEGRFPSGYGYPIVNSPPPVGQTIIYEINRTSRYSATFSAYNASNQLLGSYTDNNLGGAMAGLVIPDQLHIALYTQSATATFSYVDIPEPAAVGMLATLPILLRRRRRRRRPH